MNVVAFQKVCIAICNEGGRLICSAIFRVLDGLHVGALCSACRADELKNLQFFIGSHGAISFLLLRERNKAALRSLVHVT